MELPCEHIFVTLVLLPYLYSQCAWRALSLRSTATLMLRIAGCTTVLNKSNLSI